jgi:hypothetical protein
MNRLARSRYSNISWPETEGTNSVTKGTAQAIENRRTQQERLDVFGLLVQDFFKQVFHHETVAAGE